MRRFLLAVTLALSACAPDPSVASETPSPTSDARPTPVGTAALRTSPAVVPSPPAPSATPITDLAQVVRPLTAGWRPDGPTLMLQTGDRWPFTLVAVPFDATGPRGAPVPVLEFAANVEVRRDGAAVLLSVGTGQGIRFATWDLATNRGVWVPTARGVEPSGAAVWSKDGSSLFYTTSTSDLRGEVRRVDLVTGTDTSVARLERFGQLEGVTPDGGGLILSRGQEGGSADIIDVASGVDKHLADVASITSIRAQQPRLLLEVGGCCAGRPGGSLEVWDDSSMTHRALAERATDGSLAWGRAVWDPTGTHVAAIRFSAASPDKGSLVLLRDGTNEVQPIPGLSVGVPWVWIDEGLVITTAVADRTRLVLLPPARPAVTLYEMAGGLARVVPVQP